MRAKTPGTKRNDGKYVTRSPCDFRRMFRRIVDALISMFASKFRGGRETS